MSENVYFDCLMFKDPIKEGGKKRCIRIGSAKLRDDGGFQVYLDALPPDGRFAILPQQERSVEEKTKSSTRRRSRDDDDDIPM